MKHLIWLIFKEFNRNEVASTKLLKDNCYKSMVYIQTMSADRDEISLCALYYRYKVYPGCVKHARLCNVEVTEDAVFSSCKHLTLLHKFL